MDTDELRGMQIEPVEILADPTVRDATKPIYDEVDLVRALRHIAR